MCWSGLLWPHSPHIWEAANSCTGWGWTGWPGSDSEWQTCQWTTDPMNEQVRGHVTAPCSRPCRPLRPPPLPSPRLSSCLTFTGGQIKAARSGKLCMRRPAAYRPPTRSTANIVDYSTLSIYASTLATLAMGTGARAPSTSINLIFFQFTLELHELGQRLGAVASPVFKHICILRQQLR